MARSLRDIRRKMKAIKSTRQVTKAMELVAASKMRRAVSSAVTLRRYALSAWEILQNIAKANRGKHPYLTEQPTKNVLAIVLTSDRGLCGSLNLNVCRAAEQYWKTASKVSGVEKLDFVAVGRKSQQFLARAKHHVIAAFPAFSNHPTFKDVLPVTRLATEQFLNGTYDHVVLIFPHFQSALAQHPTIKVLLPFTEDVLTEMLGSLGHRDGKASKQPPVPKANRLAETLMEPSQTEIFRLILPQLTEVQMYQAILESAASEHSARMLAMRSASDNASEIIDDLTLTYNQTRQAGITAELAELSAASASMS